MTQARPRWLHALAWALAALTVIASPAWAGDVRLPYPDGVTVVLSVPDGWRVARKADPVPTVFLTPATGGSFVVIVSALVAPDGRLAPASFDALRRSTEGAANEARSQSVEKSLPIQLFGSGPVQGNYFSATDRAPKPGEFKFLTQGAMSVSGLPVGFTILSNGNAQLAVGPAMRMFTGARKE